MSRRLDLGSAEPGGRLSVAALTTETARRTEQDLGLLRTRLFTRVVRAKPAGAGFLDIRFASGVEQAKIAAHYRPPGLPPALRVAGPNR